MVYLIIRIFKLKISIRSESLNEINFNWIVKISLGGKLSSNDFQNTFNMLREVLNEHEKKLHVHIDKKDTYYLNAGYDEKRKTDIFFGAVMIKKNYVSYHLMPVYCEPKLLKDISPEMKKRMQGKSCFNFKTIDKEQLKELTALTKKSFGYYQKEKML